jgi:hypothetical protein
MAQVSHIENPRNADRGSTKPGRRWTGVCLVGALSALGCPAPRAASRSTLPQAEQALEDCKTRPCSDARLGELENGVGFMYMNRRDAVRAEPHFRSAVAYHKRAFGSDDARTVTSIDNLATALTQQGKVAESLPLHQEACAFFENHPGPHRSDLGICLVNLGHAFAVGGDRPMAIASYKRALQIFSARRGSERELDVLVSLMGALTPSADRLQVSLPGMRWFLRVGGLPALHVDMDQIVAPGNERYVFATNDQFGVGVSVRLRKATVGSARACREADHGPAPAADTGVQSLHGFKVSEHGAYSELEYQTGGTETADPRLAGLNQLNVFRYLIHDGVCIMVHVSRDVHTPADRSLLEQILSTVAILGFDELS